MKKGGKQKLLDYFIKNVNSWIPYTKLADVAGISDWARQVRTLRQEGWKIEQRGGGIKSEYLLSSVEKAEGRERGYISKKLRVKVLTRDNKRCVYCGKNPIEDDVKLQIDHKIPVDWGGQTVADNLQTLCSDCNLGKKAYFADFDGEIMKGILFKKTGMQRLLQLAKTIINKPIDVEFINSVAGIRDWTRSLRKLRQDGKVDYEWDSKNKTYTFKSDI